MDERKYEDALKRASKLRVQNPFDTVSQMVENIFPELKESKDERIRKEIIDFVKSRGGFKGDWIAWLEKQGEQEPIDYNEELKKCRESYLYFLDKYVKFEKRKPALSKEDERIRKGLIKAVSGILKDNTLYGTDVTREEALTWLEKQGGHKGTDNGETEFHVGDLVVINETTYQITEISNSHVVLSFNGRECKFGLDVLNNAQKFEPQFKVGDWITDGHLTCKVLSVTGKSYELHLYNDDYCHFETDVQSVDKRYHLWTIADAKDGDVLVAKDGHPFIFTGEFDVQDDNPTAYCGINSDDKFITGKGSHWTFKDGIKPATKEQRDLLFQKMKEAGYEWNADKKELKRVEPKILDINTVIGQLLGNC